MMLVYNNTLRFRLNEVRIEKGNIIVKHASEVTEILDVDLESCYYDEMDSNSYISELLDITKGYCPSYLKNKIKWVKKLETNFDEFDEDIKHNWRLYLSLYRENELVNEVLDFGKSIWSMIKPYRTSIIKSLVNQDRLHLKIFVDYLGQKEKILSTKIDRLIQRIGVPVSVYKDQTGDLYSNWNEFVYGAMLLYIIRQMADGGLELVDKVLSSDNNLGMQLRNVVLYYLNNMYSNKKFSLGNSFMKLNKDTKEILWIYSLMPFVFNYVNNHYGMYAYDYEFWVADHLVDVLEDHRDYLMTNAKNSIELEKIKNYKYDELQRSYNRKTMQY